MVRTIAHTIFFFVVIFSFFSLTGGTLYAATIYSNSSTGNDTTGDGSSGTPYATFHKAYTVAAASGDTISLEGTFDWTNAGETGDASGTGYTLGKSLIIQGNGTSTTFIQAASSENTADRGVFTVSSAKTVTIKNLTVRYGVSTATQTAGGITNSGTLNIQLATISYNRYNSTTNYDGAGGIMLKHDASGTVNISTSTIERNTFNGKYYGSGGLFSGQSNTIVVTASTFNNNTAISSNPTTFAYSYAEPSGALGVFRFVTTTITNSTFSNNTTNSYGGALQVYYPNSFKITNTTIANNNADAGAGGILFESVTDGYNLHMKNTILANNTGGGSANDFYVVSGSAGRITDNGYNIVEVSTNKTWNATGDVIGDQASLNLSSSLASNSATNGIRTLALSSGSVAINAGNSATHSSIAIPTFDQRGGTRNSTTDIGSFEYGAGGVSDVTAPSVSLTAPSSGATVAGSSVALTASASDNVSLAGVSFYIDGVLQGSEDTTSTYGITWNSTATTTGSHTAFAVARDSSNNYATSSSVSFTVDNTAPVISAVSVTTATTTATVTWTTGEAGSSQVRFGLTSSYGTSSAQRDTSPRVTSHSISLALLRACTQYYYQVESKDASLNTATSSSATFLTTGCTGSTAVSTTTNSSITTASGGTLTEGSLSLIVPTSFTATTSSAIFQAHSHSATSFFTAVTGPSGKSRVGDEVFNLKAFSDATTTLSSFLTSLTITLAYTADDVVGIEETSLVIYRYDGASWYALSNCSVDTSAKEVTCDTTSFSDFALFGDTVTASAQSVVGNGPLFMGSAKDLPGYVVPRPQRQHPDGTVEYLDDEGDTVKSVTALSNDQIGAVSTSTSIIKYKHMIFTQTLRARMTHEDVRRLQQFLNDHGVQVAHSGIGSKGNETDYFGPLTYNALVAFQEKYKDSILTPLSLKRGSGIFGIKTREVVNTMIESGDN